MSDIKTALSKRFEKTSNKATKMDKLAEASSFGSLSSFSGVFKVCALTESETLSIQELLEDYKTEGQESSSDLQSLIAITSEVKAIHNQAIILHGERIKKAQQVLSKYRDGAFSAWLMATYGNRQTPYNFLQYYEFYSSFSEQMQKNIDRLPKQVVYTLASRAALKEEKEKFILSYQGETKTELLNKLRDLFPLEDSDERKQKNSEQAVKLLKKLISIAQRKSFKPSKNETEALLSLCEQFQMMLKR